MLSPPVPAEKCFGCAACADVCPCGCIEMVEDGEGFPVPSVSPDKCIHCGFCVQSCPAANTGCGSEASRVLAAWAKDRSVRTSSSSGGVYQVLARWTLGRGGMVNGTRFDENFGLVHVLSDDMADLKSFCGSKYVQSDARSIYFSVRGALELGREVLFTSVPCQVDALYRFIGGRPHNLTTCDLVCHGVPSPAYFRKVMQRDCAGSGRGCISFRSPEKWGRFGVQIDGRPLGSASDLYMRAFLNGVNFRNTCYSCPYATRNRVGDLTLGDFWGVGKWRRFGGPVSEGVSLVLANTAKGAELLDKVKDELETEERSWREASRVNLQLSRPTVRPECRDGFYAMAENEEPRRVIAGCGLAGESVWRKAVMLPRRIAGMVVRALVRLTGMMD